MDLSKGGIAPPTSGAKPWGEQGPQSGCYIPSTADTRNRNRAILAEVAARLDNDEE